MGSHTSKPTKTKTKTNPKTNPKTNSVNSASNTSPTPKLTPELTTLIQTHAQDLAIWENTAQKQWKKQWHREQNHKWINSSKRNAVFQIEAWLLNKDEGERLMLMMYIVEGVLGSNMGMSEKWQEYNLEVYGDWDVTAADDKVPEYTEK